MPIFFKESLNNKIGKSINGLSLTKTDEMKNIQEAENLCWRTSIHVTTRSNNWKTSGKAVIANGLYITPENKAVEMKKNISSFENCNIWHTKNKIKNNEISVRNQKK